MRGALNGTTAVAIPSSGSAVALITRHADSGFGDFEDFDDFPGAWGSGSFSASSGVIFDVAVAGAVSEGPGIAGSKSPKCVCCKSDDGAFLGGGTMSGSL